MQINQYLDTATVVTDADWTDWDIKTGPGASDFTSMRVSLPILADSLGAYISSDNFANEDLILSGDRLHNFDYHNMDWSRVNLFNATAGVTPSSGDANFQFNGDGLTGSDISFRITAEGNITTEFYGDNSARFFGDVGTDGNIGVGTMPVSGRRIYGVDSGSDIGVYMQTSGGTAGYFNSSSFRGIEATGGAYGAIISNANPANFAWLGSTTYGGYLEGVDFGSYSKSSAGSAGMFITVTGYAINTDGKTFIKTVGYTESNAPSAVVQIGSTTQGFLPPRMTGTQAELIPSPIEGLLLYSTDGSGTTITSKGWWGFEGSTWVKLN